MEPKHFSKASWDEWQLKTARTWHDLEDTYQTVYHQELDKEHLVLVDLVLELNTMIDKLKEASFSLDFIYQIAEICDRLYQRLGEHFELEESVMEELEIENRQVHHEQHQKILHELEVLLTDLNEGKFAVNLEFKNQILVWTLEHMLETDYQSFTPRHIAFFMFQCKEFKQLEHWIPKTGIEFDENIRQITKFLMTMYHFKKGSSDELARLMERCFVKEERILLNYLPKSVFALHVRKHREILSIVQSGPKMNIEKVYQLWLSHLMMRDREDYKVEHWLHHDLVGFMEHKPPAIIREIEELSLELSKDIQRMGELIQLMIDLHKNTSDMKQMIEEFKKLVLDAKQKLSKSVELEVPLLKNLDSSKLSMQEQDHQELTEKWDLLVLLIESHQLALANYHFVDLQKIWCLHRCFKDAADYPREKV